MGFYTDGITNVCVSEYDGGLVVQAATARAEKPHQCYAAGELQAVCRPEAGTVLFLLPEVDPTGLVVIAAVDEADAQTDYSGELYPSGVDPNRIRIETPREMKYLPGDRWKVYRGDAGDPSADELIHARAMFTGARESGGFGAAFGHSFGFDAADAPGFGTCFGYDFGFDCELMRFRTGPLPPGTYPVAVAVEDEAGNESALAADTVALETYPRPARDLTVEGYDKDTDTLNLSWTASEDI